jgi:TonB family protein
MDGKVVLSLLVDATGMPRNIMFLKPRGSALDQFALKIVSADRFNLGTHEGVPVVVAQSVEVDLQACVEDKKDDAGIETYSLRLRSQPVQKFGLLPEQPEEAVLTPIGLSLEDSDNADVAYYRVGGEVSAPIILNHADPEYTHEALRAKYGGICIVSMIVDAQGMPRNLHVVRALGMGLDQNAIEAVKKYRFKPAMKDGKPVPVKVNIEVNFRLYPR